ncbi:MAG: inositol monophosphatase family protein [Rhodopirellula sp. JB044]|uniref:inositol monophosphatase family protein n=1 Tax=Rhodopirellula sp. JB044 TaxID=3342844 RepID=UPI00370A7D29
MTNAQLILDTAIAASRAGGAILRRYFEEGVTMRNKSGDGGKSYDLVSDADEESEQVIASIIREAFPDHELLGEESLQGDVDSKNLWIIDPLDGTNNFAHRIEHFAVSIGYYENGEAKAGAIYNPIHDDLYTTVHGQGAFRNGERVCVSSTDQLGQAMIGCGFYYDRGSMMQATLAAIEECFSHHIHGIRRFGTASLDLCMVGCGKLEGFFEYNLSPWDFAAGSLFVTEAGGQITDARAGKLPMSSTSVVASNSHLHSALTEITQRHHP